MAKSRARRRGGKGVSYRQAQRLQRLEISGGPVECPLLAVVGGVLARLGELHRQAAAFHARQLGLLDPDGDGSWTHPSLDRLLYGDGKVLTPLYRARPGDRRVDRHTGEVRVLRAEPDAALHFEGTGAEAATAVQRDISFGSLVTTRDSSTSPDASTRTQPHRVTQTPRRSEEPARPHV